MLDSLLELVLRRLRLLSSAFLRLSALIAALSAFLFCFLSNLINFLAATSFSQGIGMVQKSTGPFSWTSKLCVADTPKKLGEKSPHHFFVFSYPLRAKRLCGWQRRRGAAGSNGTVICLTKLKLALLVALLASSLAMPALSNRRFCLDRPPLYRVTLAPVASLISDFSRRVSFVRLALTTFLRPSQSTSIDFAAGVSSE